MNIKPEDIAAVTAALKRARHVAVLTGAGVSAESGVPPLCDCGKSVSRPDVVWFTEALPIAAIDRAQQAARECDVFFSIGTSTQVFPAADLPFEAKVRGAVVVEINPDDTPLTQHADYVLRAPSGIALPALLQALG